MRVGRCPGSPVEKGGDGWIGQVRVAGKLTPANWALFELPIVCEWGAAPLGARWLQRRSHSQLRSLRVPEAGAASQARRPSGGQASPLLQPQF